MAVPGGSIAPDRALHMDMPRTCAEMVEAIAGDARRAARAVSAHGAAA
jgi:hypothetical protein